MHSESTPPRPVFQRRNAQRAVHRVGVWGVCYNMDPIGAMRWRNSIFHNESAILSSDLIVAGTRSTFEYWRLHYGRVPSEPLTTEIDVGATRARRSRRHPPGHCYLIAGWRLVREIPAGHGRSAKIELAAPREAS